MRSAASVARMTDISTRNVALLIDADNASAATLDPVLTVLAELGTVNVRRVYGNWTKPGLKPWQEMSIKHGIEPQQQFDLTKGKNATDMKMTIDAMDLLFRGRIDGFGIMSSDSDFMPLATRIRQDGVPVYGFGTSRTPDGFRQACTRFIDVGADVIKLLIDAYGASKRDERGYVSLSAMGTLAGNRSSFDTRNYGYSRLQDLIAMIPNFQSETREGGRVFVKRLR
jgi:uncharacterized protein (TIGR00288 family)